MSARKRPRPEVALGDADFQQGTHRILHAPQRRRKSPPRGVNFPHRSAPASNTKASIHRQSGAPPVSGDLPS